MRILLILLLLLPSGSYVLAAGLEVTPSEVENGGVALLRWQGDPDHLVVARYRERILYLRPTEEGAVALLGTDVELEPGTYPVLAAAVDRRGRSTFFRTELKVVDAGRGVERLSLPQRMVSPRDPEVLERILRERDMLGELFADRTGSQLWQAFRRPVPDPVSSPFGLRRILNGEPRSPHSGVDFRSPAGRPVRAAARGEVVLAEELYFTGRTVVLDHGDGLYTLYAHLEETACRTGQVVEGGDVLGSVGSTGRSTGPHLHWGGKLRGDRVDPLALVALLGEEKP